MGPRLSCRPVALPCPQQPSRAAQAKLVICDHTIDIPYIDIHTAPGLPRGQPAVLAAPATRVSDGTPRRGRRSSPVRGGLHRAGLCTVWACATADRPDGMGHLLVYSSPCHVPEITRTLRSFYAYDDDATDGGPHQSLWL